MHHKSNFQDVICDCSWMVLIFKSADSFPHLDGIHSFSLWRQLKWNEKPRTPLGSAVLRPYSDIHGLWQIPFVNKIYITPGARQARDIFSAAVFFYAVSRMFKGPCLLRRWWHSACSHASPFAMELIADSHLEPKERFGVWHYGCHHMLLLDPWKRSRICYLPPLATSIFR